uniref:Uncharacterized protein n=1 Tax=Triticum urartu TaxID=4572 RepID=A0A8R7TR85_TRIUA
MYFYECAQPVLHFYCCILFSQSIRWYCHCYWIALLSKVQQIVTCTCATHEKKTIEKGNTQDS